MWMKLIVKDGSRERKQRLPEREGEMSGYFYGDRKFDANPVMTGDDTIVEETPFIELDGDSELGNLM
ncbi:hypothetical protein HanXRQr2_Chr12g0551871 [Helianthus annuus]|uniref:Uncharacterized protein n=1 Tax=Helianthus annuus TaxID=4232 RepID=A0A251T504_HELAN|nr:hypothetical protein HanXRQr2_Chr12g0551871 [Helianthus annuus]KAJ0863543.1 hypothetical protein HanPSC8_Chr12g0531291 [Helianthus annuus]